MAMGNSPNPTLHYLFRILEADAWTAAHASGSYAGAAHDLADGFLHLSMAHQVAGTLRAHYPGRAGLVLLRIATDRLPAAPVFEPSRAGELFPHLYAPLPVSAVEASYPLAVRPDGTHQIPQEALV